MPRRVFVHVGAPKTGSTFVQNVLWANREALLRTGILMPGSRTAQDQAMTDLRQAAWRDVSETYTWDMLVDTIGDWPGDVVITNEGLGGATAEQAHRAVASLQPAEVHVIVVGRDLWRTFPSVWQENIRSRSVGSFDAFLTGLEKGRNDAFWNHTANRMLRRWGDLVPAAQRHLITVPPPGSSPLLIWERFAGIAGIADGVCEIGEPAANPSLGAAEIELLRRINMALGDRYPHRIPYRRGVLRHLVNPVLKQGRNDLRFGVGADRAQWVRDLSEERIQELQEYPCHIVGDLNELRPGDMRDAMSPDEITDGQILDTAIETIIGMLGYADSLAQHPRRDLITRLKGRLSSLRT
ncbi:hypothetical protein [Actinoplanes sp. NBRC 101535]|uniref:hypothetical protein n=1 Tax=Actinoplanes sp. NBRC 101535 TaxID=3032196 RepID=UPI0024A5EFB2|nr:hypothetical protein [Actinoplanes sp. NBRC 101535]GLY07139.1 hypothetical protein Acsp01_75180 [Actinoplanes sp. NBRC 101535]